MEAEHAPPVCSYLVVVLQSGWNVLILAGRQLHQEVLFLHLCGRFMETLQSLDKRQEVK